MFALVLTGRDICYSSPATPNTKHSPKVKGGKGKQRIDIPSKFSPPVFVPPLWKFRQTVWISSLTNPKGQPSCLSLFFYETDYPPHQYSWKPVWRQLSSSGESLSAAACRSEKHHDSGVRHRRRRLDKTLLRVRGRPLLCWQTQIITKPLSC